MLADLEIQVGKCYVNEKTRVAREIMEEVDRHKVKYNAFDLVSGRLVSVPFQICFKSQIVRWADREANLAEISRFHPHREASPIEKTPTGRMESTELELSRAWMQHAVRTNSLYR